MSSSSPESELFDELCVTADCAGMRMTLAEFDATEDCEEGYSYELLRGLLVVKPIPSAQHQNLKGEILYRLLTHTKRHSPNGTIDDVLTTSHVYLPESRPVADFLVWCGLGRRTDFKHDIPAILGDIVSPGRTQWIREYQEKRDEYFAYGVKEYWLFNRFDRTLTIFKQGPAEQVLPEAETYRTPLLPGFELSLAKIFAQCTD